MSAPTKAAPFHAKAGVRQPCRQAPALADVLGTGLTPRPAGSLAAERSSLPTAAQASVVAKTFA